MSASGSTDESNEINDKLLKFLSLSDNENNRAASIKAIGNTLNPEMKNILIPFLDSELKSERLSAFQSLENLIDSAIAAPNNKNVDVSITSEETDLQEKTKQNDLNDQETDENSEKLSPDNIAEFLIEHFDKETEPDVRKAIMACMIKLKDKSVVQYFNELRKIEKDDEIKDIMIEYLSNY